MHPLSLRQDQTGFELENFFLQNIFKSLLTSSYKKDIDPKYKATFTVLFKRGCHIPFTHAFSHCIAFFW